MRFLFILDSVEAPAAVNPQLGRRLAAELADLGHTVHLLELWDGQTPPPLTPGTQAHDLPFADERLMNTALENGVKTGSPLPLRLARLARHPSAVCAAVRQLVLHKPRRTVDCRAAVERLDATHHFDCIVAVCAPYRSAFALETARVGAKKVLWQLDPYAANGSYRAPGGYAREIALMNAVDAAFITPTAQSDYNDPASPLAVCRSKVHLLGFPCLLPPIYDANLPDPHPPYHCVFCGTLYPGLRTPDFALELFAKLNAPEWDLILAGNGCLQFPAQVAAAKAVLGGRLQTLGPVPPGTAKLWQSRADVLLSIGNTVDNQLPSKLFEYLGTGKPILHLSYSLRDPVVPYLEPYPQALVMRASEGAAPEKVALMGGWLHALTGRPTPYHKLAAMYPQFTPKVVAETFLETVQRL